jgi:hypothetical protein
MASRRVAAASAWISALRPYFTFTTSPPARTQSNFGDVPDGASARKRHDGWEAASG